MIGRLVTLNYRRPGAGANVAHVWTPGAWVTGEIECNVQPATPDDLALLPEGDRSSGGIVIYTDVELQVENHAAAVSSDQVQWSGEWYRVVQVEDWSQFALASAHYRAVAVRVSREA